MMKAALPNPCRSYISVFLTRRTNAAHSMKKNSFLPLLKTLFLPFLVVISGTVTAQDVPITIKVSNTRKDPVSFASITIINRLDSSQTMQTVADSSGKAVVRLNRSGLYSTRITAVNYQPLEKGISISGTQTHFSFTLEPAGKTLETAVVKSQRPLMRQEDDKTIIEPENLAATSTSGYEVIEKTPGLFVDQDGNIYISSLTPATVQINGREMKMSASDVATMLKSLPPGAISRIEIVRTPSAKYDATGGGGIVNVVLKKGVKIGMTGSVNAGWQQGVYATEFAGFTLNNNDGKKSSFINLNISNRESYERIKTDRVFAPDTMLSQDAYTNYPSTTYFGGYGLEFALKKKWNIDFAGSVSLNDFNNRTRNPSQIRKISTGQESSSIMNRVSNDGFSLNVRNGFQFTRQLDSLGSQWDNDLFHNYTTNQAEQVFSNTYPNSPVFYITGGDGTSDNKRNLFTARSDLKLKMKNKFTLEAGVKTSILGFKSITDYFKSDVTGLRQKDIGRTNTFHYDENINSMYLQGSKTFGRDAVVKIGTRLENTNMKGRQVIPDDTTFTIHRTDLFPFIYLSKNVMKIFGYDLRAYLVYRRTTSRPVYEQLNPFPRYVDEFLTEAGNPSLRPQFTQNYEANISVDERPILAIGVNDTRDIFTNVIYQSDSSNKQAYRTYDNLGKNKEWYFRGLGAIPPGGTYFIVLGAQYNHNFYQGFYENKPLSFKKGTWTFFTYQALKLDKRSQFTVNGFIRLNGQQQFYELTTFGSLTSSINRQFLKQKLVVTLSLTDMFATNRNNFHIKQGSVEASGYRQGDTRRFGLNVRYNFGIRKKEENTTDFNTEPSN